MAPFLTHGVHSFDTETRRCLTNIFQHSVVCWNRWNTKSKKWDYKFQLCSLSRLPVAKNHNFGQILTFGRLLYRPPFPNEGQIQCSTASTADPQCTFTCETSSGSVYSVALWRRKKPFFAVFGLWHLLMSPFWRQSEKAEHGCTTTNLHLSMLSKSFLYSNP